MKKPYYSSINIGPRIAYISQKMYIEDYKEQVKEAARKLGINPAEIPDEIFQNGWKKINFEIINTVTLEAFKEVTSQQMGEATDCTISLIKKFLKDKKRKKTSQLERAVSE